VGERIPFTLVVWAGMAVAEEPADFLVPVADYTKATRIGGGVEALPVVSASVPAADAPAASTASSSDTTFRLSSPVGLLAAALAGAGLVLAAVLLIKRPNGDH